MPTIHHFRTRIIHEFYLGIQIMSIVAILVFIKNFNIEGTSGISEMNIFLVLYPIYILVKLILFIRKVHLQNDQEENHLNLLFALLDGAFLTVFVHLMIDHIPIVSDLFYFYIIFQVLLFHHRSFTLFSTYGTLCYSFLVIIENPKLLISYDMVLHIFLFYVLGYILSTIINEMSRLQNYMQYMNNELEQKNHQLSEIANRDFLTNMYNHKCFYFHFSNITESTKVQNTPFSLALLDIDNFKQINDTYGHLAGDKILKGVSSIILENIRKSDIAARYGGEEFAIIFPSTSLDESKLICERIRNAVEAHSFSIDNHSINITISGGVSKGFYCDSPCQQQSFIDSVDQLLYKAKSLGKNQIQST